MFSTSFECMSGFCSQPLALVLPFSDGLKRGKKNKTAQKKDLFLESHGNGDSNPSSQVSWKDSQCCVAGEGPRYVTGGKQLPLGAETREARQRAEPFRGSLESSAVLKRRRENGEPTTTPGEKNQDSAPSSAQSAPTLREQDVLFTWSHQPPPDTDHLWPEEHTAFAKADMSLPGLMKGSFLGRGFFFSLPLITDYFIFSIAPATSSPQCQKARRGNLLPGFPAVGSPPATVSLPHSRAFPQLDGSLLPHRDPS